MWRGRAAVSLKFAVETWAPEYGSTVDSEQLEATSADVDVGVERAEGEWTAVDPAADVDAPTSLLFVDGVRRVDSRIWISDGDRTRPGVCASVAAGAVYCLSTSARVVASTVFRAVYAEGSSAAGPVLTRHGTYEFVPCVSDTPDDLHKGIRDRMALLETQVACSDGADLVIFDGPLRGRTDRNGVGFVKTQQLQYLPDREQRILATLRPGQRTPLFLIGSSGFTRWSWYLRLPGPIVHPMSGIARCELAGLGSLEDASRRADLVTSTLPRYASEPHKDARAPQNLYPIAGLENELRRRLGDRDVMERALRIAAQ